MQFFKIFGTSFQVKLSKPMYIHEVIKELRIFVQIELRICYYNAQADVLNALAVSDLLVMHRKPHQRIIYPLHYFLLVLNYSHGIHIAVFVLFYLFEHFIDLKCTFSQVTHLVLTQLIGQDSNDIFLHLLGLSLFVFIFFLKLRIVIRYLPQRSSFVQIIIFHPYNRTFFIDSHSSHAFICSQAIIFHKLSDFLLLLLDKFLPFLCRKQQADFRIDYYYGIFLEETIRDQLVAIINVGKGLLKFIFQSYKVLLAFITRI